MLKYPMVDLVGQYKKIKPEVDEAVLQVMETAAFINGPAVKQFQENLQNYLGVKHVIPCANGTDALQVASAISSKSNKFVTGDKDLAKIAADQNFRPEDMPKLIGIMIYIRKRLIEKMSRVVKSVTEPRIATTDVSKEKVHQSPMFRGKHVVRHDICTGCSACEKICPVDAIVMSPLPIKKPKALNASLKLLRLNNPA